MRFFLDHRFGVLAFGIAWAWTAAGCSDSKGPTSAPSALVLAAASTKDALAEAIGLFAEEQQGKIVLSTDDSGKLAQQILQDAPADLFLSANETWVKTLRDQGRTRETVDLLGNRLTLAAPRDNPAGLKKIEDLADKRVRNLALAGPKVPAGIYARQALKSLGLLDGFESSQRIVSGDNVRTTLAYVDRGEVDAGIVYATDVAAASNVVTIADFPESSHEPIRYPLALLETGADNATAKAFYAFLQSEKGTAVFRKHGFGILKR